MRKIAFRIPSGTSSEIRVYDLLGTTPLSNNKVLYRTPAVNFICEMVFDPDWGEMDEWYMCSPYSGEIDEWHMCSPNSNTPVTKVKLVPIPEEELGW